MKHLKLLVALVLLALVVVSVSVAGNATKNRLSTTPERTATLRGPQSVLTDSDIPAGRALKSTNRALDIYRKDKSLAHPTPKKMQLASVTSGLSGTYHIPGSFSNIASAVAVLNFVGLAGNATFVLDNASYNEPSITFGPYPGAGTYTATFQPNTGVAVTVDFINTATDGKGFAFVGASGITIDGLNAGGSSLTLQMGAGHPFPSGDPFGSTIYITGGCDNIAVKNASIKGNADNAVWANQTDGRSAIHIFTADADPSFSTNITFDGLTITHATYGILCLPESPAVTVDGLTVNNCRIGGAYGDPVNIGGFYEYPAEVTFTNNIIDGTDYLQTYWYNGITENDNDVAFGVGSIVFNLGQATGSHFISVDAGVFHNNIIRNVTYTGTAGDGTLSYGSRVSQGNNGLNIPALVYNNRIYGITNAGGSTTQITGLRGTAGHVYHNSILLSGTLVGSGMVSRCINGVTDAYNNALENLSTGPTPANITAIVSGGTIDHNAAYSTGRAVSGFALPASAAAAGINAHGTFGPLGFTSDLHLDPAGPSSAENMGQPHILAANDIDGDPRDTTIAGTRDAGADEVSAALTSPFVNDVGPGAITSPASGGVPTGLVQTPVVVVKNNTNAAVGPFNLRLQVSDGYDQTVAVSLTAEETKSVTFPNWTPAAAGTYTFTATSQLAGDVVPGNDVFTRSQAVQAPVAVTGTKLYNWDASDDGWTRTVDFVRKSTFTKLGGPYAGASMVTERPNLVSTYTEGAYANTQGYTATYPGPNLLISPWFNFSGMTGDSLYISFVHSIETEPSWDASWLEYTNDGVHWHHLGALNDPNGVNWYSQAVYKNALSGDGTGGGPFDTATMSFPQYALYGPGSSNPTLPIPIWTSNGAPGPPLSVEAETGPQGPTGWIYNQLRVTAANYPTILHAPLVKFRYVAFSDAVAAYGGWGVDNFQVSNAAPVFLNGFIAGKAFVDVNGNGVYDAGIDSVDAGRKIYKSYFGVLQDSTTTDVNGDYSVGVTLPGVYNIQIVKTGYAFTVPFGTSNTANVSHPSDGSTVTQNLASYHGGISGRKFSDINDNGVEDLGEPGLQFWTVEVHKDSLNGALFASQVTNATGAYSFVLPPHTWYVKEIAQPTVGRKTMPAGAGYTQVVGGTSGSGTALITGLDFGNFIYATLRVEASIDVFGDGNKDVSDHTSLPALVTQSYEVRKNGTLLSTDLVGNTVPSILHSSLDTGFYSVKRISATPANFLKTSVADSFGFTVTTSGNVDTANYLYFKLVSVSGHKFNDLNGNGALDAGEPGIANWPINVSGTGGGTVLTDSNGNYTINTLAQGSHTISEVSNPAWTQTFAAAGLTFTAQSGNLPGSNKLAKDFGNFKNVCIGGVKYRDRNNNGVQDAGEEGLAGWTINLTGQTSVVTDANGNFSFCNVGPSPDTVTLSETPQAGWTQTQPAGTYTIILTSGDSVMTYKFGNFKGSDTTLYRTFTAAQYGLTGNAKPVKAWTAKKPTVPNLGNLINNLYLGGAGSELQVGLSGQTNAGGKEKGYVLGAKQGDVFKTFNVKGAVHTGAARGIDFGNTSKILLKRFKSLPPTTKNDILVADMQALKLNISASTHGITSSGLATLKYNDAGHPLNGKTITEIGQMCDTIMTNWEGLPYATYVMFDSVIAKINAAFSDGSATVPYDTGNWHAGTLHMTGLSTVYAVPFLLSNPGVVQTTPPPMHLQVPTTYALQQNYPNPFNPTTSIQFQVPTASIVTIKVYNMLGQEVATLLNHQLYDGAQMDEVDFDASHLASGVYLYRIIAQSINDDGVQTGETFTQVKKMMLVK